MQLEFDVFAAEDAAHTAREALVHRFEKWLGAHPEHAGAEPWDVDLLLTWKLAYGDGHMGRWTRGEVDEILLEHMPRKLAASREDAASIPVSLSAFVGFLAAEGLLSPDSDPAPAVAARAQAQSRAFLDAMADPGNFGMAKSLFGAAGFDPDEPPSEADIAAAIAQFNAVAAGSGDDDFPDDEDLPALPLRSFASDGELAALAPTVPLVRRVDALQGALLATPCKLTKAGNPTLADGRRLVEATGVGDMVQGIRSSTDLPGLYALCQVAMRAGAARVQANRLQALKGWAQLPVHERWQRLVEATLDAGPATLAFGATIPMPQQLAEYTDEVVPQLVALLWLAGERVLVSELVELLVTGVTMDHPPLAPLGRADLVESLCRQRVDDVVEALAGAGLLSADGHGDERTVELTAAAPRLVADTLREEGFDVLSTDEVIELETGELLDALDYRAHELDEVTHLLRSAHGDGAAQLLLDSVVSEPEPSRILVAFSILQQLGPEAIAAARSALDSPVAGHAWLFLLEAGEVSDDEVPRDAALRAGVDVFLATAQLGTPADAVEALLTGLPQEEHKRLINDLAGSGHPQAADLLEIVGLHHPHKAMAKHARKTAERVRRQATSR